MILALLCAAPACAQEPDLVHSDRPLWSPGTDAVWPQHFTDGDTFGCAHRLRLGDWLYKPTEGDDQWYRFGNYGVFHCWMTISHGDAPRAFGDSRPAFLISLGREHDKELWVLQLGARPGSDYILLAGAPGKGSITRFEVLQRLCPKASVRGGPPLDILQTRYCSINTKSEMLALARRMAKLPALGVMAFEGEPPGDP